MKITKWVTFDAPSGGQHSAVVERWHAAATCASHYCLRGLGRLSEAVPEERWPHSCEGVRPVSYIAPPALRAGCQ